MINRFERFKDNKPPALPEVPDFQSGLGESAFGHNTSGDLLAFEGFEEMVELILNGPFDQIDHEEDQPREG